MATITLRAYMREIESLIDSGQYEETVAHCRYILQSFPKHIDTYRLLGKVFLESKQFSNAADILQRVLSAVPDDFVSHLGMSIIREDEGNLDAAIWHMERAFESKPANKAIQEELRRLFGRRDGVEPPKIRLTRGALARMYSKGNLYDQAIAELRGALSEDPQRPDLLLLLAQMNYLTGNRVEAVETSSNLLKKFPYCLGANRILALILPHTDRSEDAKVYQQRAIALDPYLRKAGDDALTSEDISDSAVMIELLERKPGQPIEGLTDQPAWAASLGIKLEETVDEDLPEWLSEDIPVPSYEGEQIAPFVEEAIEAEGVAEAEGEAELIPEWMKEAGWQPTEDVGEGLPPQGEVIEAQEAEGGIEKAEIPDWLKEMATVEGVEEEPMVESISEDALPPWLDETPPGPTDSIISWLDIKDEGIEKLESEGLSESEEEVEIPSWLQELNEEIEADVSAEASPPSIEELEESAELEAEKAEEIPEWLIEAAEPVSTVSEETKTFIEGVSAETTEEGPEVVESLESEISEESVELPEWLQEIESEITVETAPEDLEEISESTDQPMRDLPIHEEEIEIPDWLKNLDEEIEGESLFDETLQEKTEIPEWLQELEGKSEVTERSEDFGTEWTPQIQAEQEVGEGQTEELDQEMQDSTFAWLESLAAKQGASEEELITKPEERLEAPPEWILEEELSTNLEAEVVSPEGEQLPDLLQGVDETSAQAVEIEQGEATGELPAWLHELEPEEKEGAEPSLEGVVEEELPLSDEDAGLAWLESLAAKQGVSEEELITRPEDRLVEPPAWVSEEVEDLEIPQESQHVEGPSLEAQEEISISEEIPTWMPETQDQAVSVTEEPDLTPEEMFEPETRADLNAASLSELENVPGVGFILAQNIIIHRDEHGPFESIDELKDVAGVDRSTFESIQDRFSVKVSDISVPKEVSTGAPEKIENEHLREARSAIEVGDYDRASKAYDQLIKQSKTLEDVISVLEAEISEKPDNIVLWQTLGDAYMRNDQFQKALDAYTKAEKLL